MNKRAAKKIVDRIKSLNRNVVLAIILAIVLIIVGSWSFIFHANNTAPADLATERPLNTIETTPPMGATVDYAEGVVEYATDGVWSEADKAELISGMSLRTVGAASKAIIKLDDGSEVRLDANTEVVFETLTINRVAIIQNSGYVYSRITDSTTRSYDIHTEHAQFQSNGTAFRTSAGGDEEAVEVFQGSVTETINNMDAAEGKKLIIFSALNSDNNKKTVSLNIEKLKDDSFIIWNRQRDLKNNRFRTDLGFLSDFEGPGITINSPSAGKKIELPEGSAKATVVIKGQTEPGTSLEVRSKSSSSRSSISVPVESDGSFQTGELKGVIGNSVFEFTAKDRVGNISVKSVSYTFKTKNNTQEKGIELSYTMTTDKLKLHWKLTGMTTPEGVIVVESVTDNPQSPADDERTVPTGTSTEFDLSSFSSGDHYFKVCRYLSASGGCDIYSNAVLVTIP